MDVWRIAKAEMQRDGENYGGFETSGEQRRTRGTVTASLDVDKGRSKENRKDVLRVPSINTFTLFAEHL